MKTQFGMMTSMVHGPKAGKPASAPKGRQSPAVVSMPCSNPPCRNQVAQQKRDSTSRGPKQSPNSAIAQVDEPVQTCEVGPAEGNKAPAPTCKEYRTRCSSNSVRRSSKVASVERDELVETDDFMPFGVTSRKGSCDSESASTLAPSAETSPALTFVADAADADEPTWPSLREATSGFDFCSDCSDSEELWEDLPEPALDIDDSVPQAATAAKPKLSYAELLCQNPSGPSARVNPPACGTLVVPPNAKQPLQRPGHGISNTVSPNDGDIHDQDFESHVTQRHGWTKQHKTSWNKKQQRRVAERMQCRTKQSCQTRGWLKPDNDDNED